MSLAGTTNSRLAYEVGGVSAKAKEAKLTVAKHWEAEAGAFKAAGGESFQISHRLEQAIAAYRKAGRRRSAPERPGPVRPGCNQTLTLPRRCDDAELLPINPFFPLFRAPTCAGWESPAGGAATRFRPATSGGRQ